MMDIIIQLLQHPVIRTILSVVLPILVLPFLMRLIIGRIILFRVRRKYLPKYLKNLYAGWESEEDKKAIKEVSRLALQRLKYHFIFKPEFTIDAKALLISIKSIYEQDKKDDEFVFTFSILSLIECALLAFSDIYKEYSNKPWFRIIQNVFPGMESTKILYDYFFQSCYGPVKEDEDTRENTADSLYSGAWYPVTYLVYPPVYFNQYFS